jgi:hypothetical protein
LRVADLFGGVLILARGRRLDQALGDDEAPAREHDGERGGHHPVQEGQPDGAAAQEGGHRRVVDEDSGQNDRSNREVFKPEPPPHAKEVARVQHRLFAQLLLAQPQVGFFDQQVLVLLAVEGALLCHLVDELAHAFFSILLDAVLAFEVRAVLNPLVQRVKHGSESGDEKNVGVSDWACDEPNRKGRDEPGARC